MMRTAILFLLLNLWVTCLALQCMEVPGRLKQIDAGNGQVFGVCPKGEIFTLYGSSFIRLQGLLKHVSVGPAGVWGVNSTNQIHKLVKGDWVPVPGTLKQVDAGGKMFAAGVNPGGLVFCLSAEATTKYAGPGSPASWTQLPGKLKYYSCGPYSCWGVNLAEEVFLMKGVTPTACAGSLEWQQIPGALSMIEVSTDGKVYGLDSEGDVHQREGVAPCNPAGTGWRKINLSQKVKHVSYDLGHLWLVGRDNHITYCTE
ncbi:fish-egg lectin-like [Colossoma macropomum]|uniref:fish-egg lectin-like n=1 Tax=Colossoma macropomum TaxID=42526 RepID=UPI0018648AD1|nr:fish-egg lectin-like [Colossoma macropomum]